jgi:hypothetical protein
MPKGKKKKEVNQILMHNSKEILDNFIAFL